MANVISAVNERNFVAQSVGVAAERLSPSQLRSEVVLGTSAQYQYFFTQTGKTQNVIPTDVLLKQTDGFCITAISFALKQISAATPTAAQHGIAILYQFNNVKVFTQTNDANMQAIYNGYASILLDSVQVAPVIMMRNFERVSTAQQGVVTAAITGPTTYTQGRDELPYATFGDMPLTPLLVRGNAKFEIDLNLGGGAQTIATTNSSNYGVFILRGFLVNNILGVN
jgi:hypothetical protein